MRGLLMAAALAAVACHSGRERQTAPSAAEIPIGVFAALTGPEAAFGNATLHDPRPTTALIDHQAKEILDQLAYSVARA